METRKTGKIRLMITLAINTATSTQAVAIISDGKLLEEIVWKGNADETKKLLPTITELLKKVQLNFKKINRIIAVNGPGSFSAVRIGVTVANMLSWSLKIPLYTLNSKTLWQNRLPNKFANKNTILLLHAGGNFVNISSKKRDFGILNIGTFRPKADYFYGDITANEMIQLKKNLSAGQKILQEKSLKNFGETIAKLKSSALKKIKIANPLYWRPPTITNKML